MEEKRGRIESAAKELFIKRGFHAMASLCRGERMPSLVRAEVVG